MEDTMKSPNLFERLPPELNQLILSCVPDVFSLHSAVSSCRSLRSAFQDVEQRITGGVMLENIHPAVLPDIIAHHESLSADPFDYGGVGAFIEKHYGKDRSIGAQPWKLRAALAIANFHRLILHYTDIFVSEAAATFPDQRTSPSSQQMPVTLSEVLRIQQSLYRYEIFCNIFRIEPRNRAADEGRRYKGYDAQKSMRLEDAFLSKFSPWENEQLACTYALVVKMASPAYDEVAAHDIEWAALRVHWGKDGTTDTADHFQYYVANGLRRVDGLARAGDYSERLKILSPFHRQRESLGSSSARQKEFLVKPFLGCRGFFVKNAFRRINGRRYSDDDPASDDVAASYFLMLLNQFTPEEERKFVNAPFFNDPDPGPAKIWRWAHASSHPQSLVDAQAQKNLRGWGYVMWDDYRLEELAIFQEHFRNSRHRSRDPAPLKGRPRHEMVESITARIGVYDKGGRGWWSEDDQSHVVWTGITREQTTGTSRSLLSLGRKIPTLQELRRAGT